MRRSTLRLASTVVVAALILLAGCAKKSKETAPVPTPTPEPPPTTAPQTPTPTEAPKPAETPSSPAVRSEDFQPAFFDFDSYVLSDAARGVLDQDAKLLRANSGLKVTIEGHCDERGTVEYNQALGEKRAQAARDYVVAAGVEASRLQIISYGKERPFDPGHDEAAWAKNRRAHFVLR